MTFYLLPPWPSVATHHLSPGSISIVFSLLKLSIYSVCRNFSMSHTRLGFPRLFLLHIPFLLACIFHYHLGSTIVYTIVYTIVCVTTRAALCAFFLLHPRQLAYLFCSGRAREKSPTREHPVFSCGRGCTWYSIFMHGRSRMTIDPRIPTMPGRSTSGFHRLSRHCLHQPRSAIRYSASRMKSEQHPS